MAGITSLTAIFADPKIPQRTFSIINFAKKGEENNLAFDKTTNLRQTIISTFSLPSKALRLLARPLPGSAVIFPKCFGQPDLGC
jgi:hypothetical protein